MNHQWTRGALLDEPGISDIDGGQWQRVHVRCESCGEERDVWKGIPLTAPTMRFGCISPRPPATNVAAIVALTCALVGLLVLPILLGPVAVIAGIVGEHQSRTEGRKLGKVALGGFVVGLIVTLIAVDRVLL